ncbi:hypothetical protein, partial [Clostridium neonatale]|uniref:hypothetical protein n=1 Tax=Clostridium neonatale TaxID=137838 RepID=UPI001A9B0D4D
QYMIGSIVEKFQLKILMAEAMPKNVCSKKTSFGQTILEQPLPKNLKSGISNTILRLSYIEFLCFSLKSYILNLF